MSMKMNDRKKKIVEFMREEAYKPLLYSELAAVLDVPKEEMDLFSQIIRELEQEGRIFRTRKERYGVPERMGLFSGRIQGHERGFAFLIPDDVNMEDIFVPANGLGGAMHGDRVVVRINHTVRERSRAEGEVINILKRANETVVGAFESNSNFGFVVPDNHKLSSDIFVSKSDFNGAKTGQKVVVKITTWPSSKRNAEGEIVEIIGDADDSGIDILSVIKAYGLSENFNEDVLEEADRVGSFITEEEKASRRDLRGLKMVTIDGEDAKDLDDAVSIEVLENGCYRLGVHIADVSYYVRENSSLDEEALKRGTSVYLVDRVIPMLPRKLSNGICSLNAGEDRLAFSVMMEIDPMGKVVNHEIFESVINVNERMTYTNVYKILEMDDAELKERYRQFVDDFYEMKKLALRLKNKRLERGAIDFDFDEAKIILDEKGKPVEVKKYEITIANKIIEEFMLLCNETVSEHFYWTEVPFVYRIHEQPDPQKIQALNEFIFNFGLVIKGTNSLHPRALQDIIKKVKGTKQERIIGTVMLRSLQKARYSHQQEGHFGLAAEYYSHFTSPIRRYPDLIIHRIMKEYIKGEFTEKRNESYSERLPEITKICSERERAAEDAERETEDIKKVEYMKDKVGEVFDAVISNILSFGMFVELENTIEGLVRISSMTDDFYWYNDKHFCLIGERTGKVYRIGDEIKVKLTDANVRSKQIDFIPVDDKVIELHSDSNTNDKVIDGLNDRINSRTNDRTSDTNRRKTVKVARDRDNVISVDSRKKRRKSTNANGNRRIKKKR